MKGHCRRSIPERLLGAPQVVLIVLVYHHNKYRYLQGYHVGTPIKLNAVTMFNI